MAKWPVAGLRPRRDAFSAVNGMRKTWPTRLVRAGEIETWGRGIHRIFQACRDAGTPEPQIRYEPSQRRVKGARVKASQRGRIKNPDKP